MGLASMIKEKYRETKSEILANRAARKTAKKQSKAAYRKEMVSSTIKIAKSEAKKDAAAGGKFKRKMKEAHAAIKKRNANRATKIEKNDPFQLGNSKEKQKKSVWDL